MECAAEQLSHAFAKERPEKERLPERMKEGSCDHDFLRQLCTAQRFSSMIIVRLLSPRAFLVGLAPPKFTRASEPALLWNQLRHEWDATIT